MVTHKFSHIYSKINIYSKLKIKVYYKLKLGLTWESLSLSSAEHTELQYRMWEIYLPVHPHQLLHMSARKNKPLRTVNNYLFFCKHWLLISTVRDWLILELLQQNSSHISLCSIPNIPWSRSYTKPLTEAVLWNSFENPEISGWKWGDCSDVFYPL